MRLPTRPAMRYHGATICNQEEADRDIPKLLHVPAAKRFLSMEPLLGPVSLDCFPVYGEDESQLLNWVIVGGESGADARPTHPEWVTSIRDQCVAAGVPFHFKQWGEWLPGHHYTDELRNIDPDLGQSKFRAADFDGDEWNTPFDYSEDTMFRVGVRNAGRTLDGRTWDEVPA